MKNYTSSSNAGIKVLLIDVNCKNSSTGKIVYDLHSNLLEEGNSSVICYGRGPLIKERNIYKISSNIEVYFHALLTRLTGYTGCFSFFSTLKLIDIIEKYKPDVIHAHELHGYFVNYGPIINYLIQSNIKTIWSFHCEFMYTGKCGHSFDCEKWKTECNRCPHLRDYPASLFFDFTKEMFNAKKKLFRRFENLVIVTPSVWLADRVRQSFLAEKKVSVIQNGIDTQNVFYPRNYDHLRRKHKLNNEKIILSVAPDLMSALKGGRHVLVLAKKMKNENVKFILIGVKDLSEKFDNNIIALGRTENQKELAEYYSMANVFVICSSKENFPTTCIEAIACGTPVCGFDEGGTKETAPGDLGEFVEYGNIDALEKSIKSFLEKSDISKSCSNYGSKHYSTKRMYNEYLNLYTLPGNSEG